VGDEIREGVGKTQRVRGVLPGLFEVGRGIGDLKKGGYALEGLEGNRV